MVKTNQNMDNWDGPNLIAWSIPNLCHMIMCINLKGLFEEKLDSRVIPFICGHIEMIEFAIVSERLGWLNYTKYDI